MQIKELVSNVASYNALTERQNHKNLPVPTFNKTAVDSVSVSDVAQRLNIKFQKSSPLEKAELTDSLPPIGKEIDSQMKKAIDILERIENLTLLAQDESLGDDSRVEIQIEIEDLRDNLMILPRNLMTDEKRPSYAQLFKNGGNLTISDNTSILERMRTRISNGEAWNVREAWALLDDNSDDENLKSGWTVVDDSNVITQEDGKFVTTTKKVPTVKERLEAGTPYVVMDAKSAEKSTALVERQIEKIQKWREKLPGLIEQYSDSNGSLDKDGLKAEAFLFLEDIVFPNGNREPSLTTPDSAYYFKIGDKIYDSPYYDYNDYPLSILHLEDGEVVIPDLQEDSEN